jgi:hypothetical protein
MLAPGSDTLRSVTDILEEMDSVRPFSENESPPVATYQEMTTGRESGGAYKRQLMQLELQYDAARRTGRGMEFYRGMLGTRLGRVLLYKMTLAHLEPDMLRQSTESRERAYNAAYTFFSERPEEERIRFATIYANGIAATRRRYFFITDINLNRADYNFRETPQEIEKEKMDAEQRKKKAQSTNKELKEAILALQAQINMNAKQMDVCVREREVLSTSKLKKDEKGMSKQGHQVGGAVITAVDEYDVPVANID